MCSILMILVVFSPSLSAQSRDSSLPPLFFDAENTGFDRHGTKQIFEGNVVTMVGGNLIWADTLSMDRDKDTFIAQGHVLVVSGKQVLGGEKLEFNFRTEDFYLTNAFVISEDPKKAEEIAHKILGVTPEELEFELSKTKQLEKIKEKKAALKKEYEIIDSSQKEMMVDEYAVLLEKEHLISKQKNPVLAQLSEAKRENIERRREYWEASKKTQVPTGQSFLSKNYTRLEGEWIERTDSNHYRASKITLTPCYCKDDEKPAWQIRADSIDSYAEGYADLDDAVIEIKGIPILYLPYLRIPMKGKRQSGFLFPSLSYNRFNGSIMSQPVYFDLAPNKDATATVDFIEKRGTRLGAQFRYQQRTYSGWEFDAEAIRDRQWLTLQSDRSEIHRSYEDGLAQSVARTNGQVPPDARQNSFSSGTLGEPQYWKDAGFDYCLTHPDSQQCKEVLKGNILAPSNTFRHKAEWKGMTFLTPRFSLVSEGKFLSDHRYMQDLYFDKFNESFNPASPDLFTKTKAHLHLDGNDFYAGVGANWGDQLRSSERFSGHQTPAYLRLRSRNFTLFEFPRPLYASLLFNYKKIDFFEDVYFRNYVPTNNIRAGLEDGNWTQLKLNLLSPITTDQAFTLNYFTELEARSFDTSIRFTESAIADRNFGDNYKKRASSLSTLRLGLDFQLPIDGTMRLSSADTQKSDGIRYLNHRTNWGITYSLRPSVVRKGPYGELSDIYDYDATRAKFTPVPVKSQRLVYFASENPLYFDSDFIPEQDKMIPHQLILFSTNHDWLTYKHTWDRTESAKEEKEQIKPVSFTESARNELEYSYQLTQLLDDSLSDEIAKKNGFYLVESDKHVFAHVDGNISYDIRKEQDKRRHKGELDLLTDKGFNPWSPARMNARLDLYDWTLTNFTKYDIYLRTLTELRFQLSPPALFDTRLSLGYSIEKEGVNVFDGLTLNRTLTRSYGLTSSVIPDFAVEGKYSIRTKENQNPSQQYYASAGAAYTSPAKCWALQFYWRKDFPDEKWTGTYYLSLIVKFFNYNREYGNLLSKVNRDPVN